MCGITALYGTNDPVDIYSMTRKLKHRGPDEYGYFSGRGIILGHTRLSIIDLKGGVQPIYNETGDKCIVCNGEIYNYKELRKEFLGNHEFKTDSDSEVLLHLFEEFGYDCLKLLNGMFAFVINDSGNIFAARDRIGIKPLYFGSKNGVMAFASEIKSLEGFEDISEFPPGYYYSNITGFHQYYSIDSYESPFLRDENEICSMIRQKLFVSVKRRLVSDVPVGIFLSGGLDSSIIAALMNPYVDKLHTFAVGTEGSDDLMAARKVAEFLNSKHYEYIYTEKEMRNSIHDVIYYLESFDAPLVRSALPNYFVARAAKGKIKVVLTGEGADELFSGYHYLKNMKCSGVLNDELIRLTRSLHNVNLQRTDRMTMAHSIEARVPFLDHEFVEFAHSIPIKLRCAGDNKMEKYLLRKAFKDYLPEEILWRDKLKFSEGSGAEELFRKIAESEISDQEFLNESSQAPHNIRGKDELYFYRIYKEHFSFCEDKLIAGVTADF
ncbi:MAG TPA: asparagine synthase B [Ignavibacteria bacterium]|nr:asparagine synthase B [Ignavibacteria bacterium]HMR00437.1 asparagine synthase B [Ignavibacteria bacterium]